MLRPRASPRGVRTATFGALALLGLAAAACGGGESRGSGRSAAGAAAHDQHRDRVGVVVSVLPLSWFVERIGGDRVEVTVMVPPGASPHLYDPTMGKMRAVAEAAVYVAVGHPRFPFESAWLGDLARSRPDLRLVRSGAACEHEPSDPHLWLAPACAREVARAVADALAAELPDAGGRIRARRDSVLGEIDAVDRELGRQLSPHAGRAFLVFHPALGYLARSYGLEQMAIQRGATEPSPAEVAAVLRSARERGIEEVFVQPQFSTEAARLVAHRLPGGRLVTIDPLAADWPTLMRDLGAALARSFSEGDGPGG